MKPKRGPATTPAERFDRFPKEKRDFFLSLADAMLFASVRRTTVQDTPGMRFRLMQCNVCRELYWLTDQWDDLDYCPTCVERIAATVYSNVDLVRASGDT